MSLLEKSTVTILKCLVGWVETMKQSKALCSSTLCSASIALASFLRQLYPTPCFAIPRQRRKHKSPCYTHSQTWLYSVSVHIDDSICIILKPNNIVRWMIGREIFFSDVFAHYSNNTYLFFSSFSTYAFLMTALAYQIFILEITHITRKARFIEGCQAA